MIGIIVSKILIMLTSFLTIAVAAIILGLLLMLLWDWLMPTIFGLGEITFFQAIGLNLISGIILSKE